ncbi:MAG TPA: exodeoxyribonuclease VII large subunit [Gammaproteobacteria bacterium]|nr:exodeoxyribonuclease VII large subunit [Gammaproteobacteria bacterium]
MKMQAAGAPVLSVTELNHSAGRLLEHSFRNIWVRGEVADLSRPVSGHLYFVLKDEQARIRCALFRNRQQRLISELKNGCDILARGTVGVYSARGDYQFIIDYLELGGEGRLRLEFDRLKQKLAAEGLFDVDRKRPVPLAPARVGIITSVSAAALQDILTTLQRRCPLLAVSLYPATVQGEQAATAVIRSLLLANSHNACDVLILARGGGSIEDLQAFNTESVARAIVRSKIPVVTGIGHETDFTIADFTADLRAPTPTAAAERVSPDSHHWGQQLVALQRQMIRAMERKMNDNWQQLDRSRLGLKDPLTRIDLARQQLQMVSQQLDHSGQAALTVRLQTLERLRQRLRSTSPGQWVGSCQQQLQHLGVRQLVCITALMATARQQLQAQQLELRAVSPEATLQRGYAIVRKQVNRALVTSAADIVAGDVLETRVKDGKIISTVCY